MPIQVVRGCHENAVIVGNAADDVVVGRAASDSHRQVDPLAVQILDGVRKMKVDGHVPGCWRESGQ